MKHPASVQLVGVVDATVGGTSSPARYRRLLGHLSETDRRCGTELRMTGPAAYRGSAPSLGAALVATLHLRLGLLPEADACHGLGRSADDAELALADVGALRARPGTRGARTGYRCSERVIGATEPGVHAVQAALLGRDELVGRLDRRSLSVLRGLLEGGTQQEVAADEGISASAVSQRVRRDGLAVVAQMTDHLRRLP